MSPEVHRVVAVCRELLSGMRPRAAERLHREITSEIQLLFNRHYHDHGLVRPPFVETEFARHAREYRERVVGEQMATTLATVDETATINNDTWDLLQTPLQYVRPQRYATAFIGDYGDEPLVEEDVPSPDVAAEGAVGWGDLL